MRSLALALLLTGCADRPLAFPSAARSTSVADLAVTTSPPPCAATVSGGDATRCFDGKGGNCQPAHSGPLDEYNCTLCTDANGASVVGCALPYDPDWLAPWYCVDSCQRCGSSFRNTCN